MLQDIHINFMTLVHDLEVITLFASYESNVSSCGLIRSYIALSSLKQNIFERFIQQFASHMKRLQDESLVIGRQYKKLVRTTKDFNAS